MASPSRSTDTGRGVLRRKPIDTEPRTGGLRRELGLWQLTAIGLGAIIGAGIFTLAGTVAGPGGGLGAGPGVTISFAVAGIASACAALAYAEFGGLIPQAGSSYTYGYAVLGEIVGWMIGWDLLLEYTAIVAVVAIAVSGYLKFLLDGLGVDLPQWLLGAPGTGHGHRFDVFAALLCVLVAVLLNRGIRSSARVETVLVAIKVTIVVAVIVVGAFYVKSSNFSPYLPNGFGVTVTGAATVFFAVFGYDALTTAAEETKNAQRVLPKAIGLSLAISMVLYLLAATVLTGMQNWRDLDPTSAFSVAFADVGQTTFAKVVAVGAIVGIATVMFSFMLGGARIWFAMSRDRLLPQWFTHTNRHRSPNRPTWIIGLAAAILAGLVPIGDAAELTNIGILLAFVVVSAAVIVLRYRSPDAPRTFRCPAMPVVPIVGIAFSIYLVPKLQALTWVRFVVWFVIGLVVYAAYGYRHSRLQDDPVRS